MSDDGIKVQNSLGDFIWELGAAMDIKGPEAAMPRRGCENICFYSDFPLDLLLLFVSPTSLAWHQGIALATARSSK